MNLRGHGLGWHLGLDEISEEGPRLRRPPLPGAHVSEKEVLEGWPGKTENT